MKNPTDIIDKAIRAIAKEIHGDRKKFLCEEDFQCHLYKVLISEPGLEENFEIHSKLRVHLSKDNQNPQFPDFILLPKGKGYLKIIENKRGNLKRPEIDFKNLKELTAIELKFRSGRYSTKMKGIEHDVKKLAKFGHGIFVHFTYNESYSEKEFNELVQSLKQSKIKYYYVDFKKLIQIDPPSR